MFDIKNSLIFLSLVVAFGGAVAAVAEAPVAGAFAGYGAIVAGASVTESPTYRLKNSTGQSVVGSSDGADVLRLDAGFWTPDVTVNAIFADGFESGDADRWSLQVGGDFLVEGSLMTEER